jgi:hypothetical protein
VCGHVFAPKSGAHKFCSSACKGKWKYVTGEGCTDNQYTRISGDWNRYFTRLRQRSDRKADITVPELLSMLISQGGKCALSGEVLTCGLKRGVRTWTNASIDRKTAGGDYTASNVQLVCAALNLFRANIPLDEYVAWCKKVANYQEVLNGKQPIQG